MFCYPYIDSIRHLDSKDIYTNIEVCSCPLNHTYTHYSDTSSRMNPFACGTKPSFNGSIAAFLSTTEKVVNTKLELTTDEVNLLGTIRKIYEKPPDRNIIAIVMFTQWIRSQRMPFESDRLIELYDAPKKKGIV